VVISWVYILRTLVCGFVIAEQYGLLIILRALTLNRLIEFDSMSGSIRTIDGYKYVVGLFYKHTKPKQNFQELNLTQGENLELFHSWTN